MVTLMIFQDFESYKWTFYSKSIFQFSSVQLLSRVQLFATPWTATRQASLSITNSQSLPKLMPIESVMPSNHLILCHPLLLLPSIFPSIRVFSNESTLCIRWPKYRSFSLYPGRKYMCYLKLIKLFMSFNKEQMQIVKIKNPLFISSKSSLFW